ncbi:hypothetical protein GC105_10715 [Alkalibaculum sp. M08DMB]|uniref:DUF3168 domain-containing protein n=1 Tax=Alkalibaculum sporogenes TaxID=2655001 RepID=A0A6A7K9Q0_9FIRM|nr:hypothetical protein [Alkalibaculum sporogenes]MPW26259.1 hypothetical protein [Alkalibaculum sporogenes]
MYEDILNSVLSLLSDYTISIGSLPPNNGIAMYIGSGAQDTMFLNKGSENNISLVVNAKNSNHSICLESLSNIHSHLTKLKDYPNSDTFQILNIRTSSAPSWIGKEQNSQHLYGSILEVSFYVKGVN